MAHKIQGSPLPEEQEDAEEENNNPQQANPSRRQLQFADVKRLVAEGYTQRAIARQLKMSRTTVRKYMEAKTFPHYGPRLPRATIIGSYVPYLNQRWTEGCHNARILYDEIRALGYPGSKVHVRCFLAPYRQKRPVANKPPVAASGWSPRRAMWLLVRASDELDPGETCYRDTLCELCPDIAAAHQLAQRFVTLIRERQVELLDVWLADVSVSNIASLKSFASGLEKDSEAVRAALTHEWSSGQVEGQVNRLKFIKRQMYGRAKFDLLRLRVLHPP